MQRRVNHINGFLKQESISNNELVIGINPGAFYGSAKRWLHERFAQLANMLNEKHKARVIFLGGPKELGMKELLSQDLNFSPVWAIGKFSLIQTAALIKRCNLVVSNDSGLMHLSAAVSTPVVALFGPTDPSYVGPQNKRSIIVREESMECVPCYLQSCEHKNCMQNLSVEKVFQACEKLMDQQKA